MARLPASVVLMWLITLSFTAVFFTAVNTVEAGTTSDGTYTDPVKIASDINSYTLTYPWYRISFYAKGHYWVFYWAGGSLRYVVSTDSEGLSWSSPVSLRSQPYYSFSVKYNGSHLFYTLVDYDSATGNYYVKFRMGTPNEDGTITWLADEQVVTAIHSSSRKSQSWFDTQIGVDAEGYAWIIMYDTDPSNTFYVKVFKNSMRNGTWATAEGFPYVIHTQSGSSYLLGNDVIGLGNGKTAIVFVPAYNNKIYVRIWDGLSGWGNTAVLNVATDRITAAADGDIIHIAYYVYENNVDKIKYVKFFASNMSFSEITVIATADYYISPSIVLDTYTRNLYVFYVKTSDGSINYVKYNSLNDTWEPSVRILNVNPAGYDYFSTNPVAYDGKISIVYTTKTFNRFRYVWDLHHVGFTLNNAPVVVAGDYATTFEPLYNYGFYAQNRHWLFFIDDYGFKYATSEDGATWSNPVLIKEDAYRVNNWDVVSNGTHVFYTISTSNYVYYRAGVLNPNGEITWLDSEQAVIGGSNHWFSTSRIVLDSNGNIWLLCMYSVPAPATGDPDRREARLEILRNGRKDGTWQTVYSYILDQAYGYGSIQYSFYPADIVPLSNGRLAVIWVEGLTISINTWDGSSWRGTVEYTIPLVIEQLGAVYLTAVGQKDSVHIVLTVKYEAYMDYYDGYSYGNTFVYGDIGIYAGYLGEYAYCSSLHYARYDYASNSVQDFTTFPQVFPDTDYYDVYPSISVDGNGHVYIFFIRYYDKMLAYYKLVNGEWLYYPWLIEDRQPGDEISDPFFYYVSKTPQNNKILVAYINQDKLKVAVINIKVAFTNTPPNPPILVSPSKNARFGLPRSIAFSWVFDDPDPGDSQSAFRLQIGNQDFSAVYYDTGVVQSQESSASISLPGFPVGVYYWRVQVFDSNEAESEWSAPRAFIVDALSTHISVDLVGEKAFITTLYMYDSSQALINATLYLPFASVSATGDGTAVIDLSRLPTVPWGSTVVVEDGIGVGTAVLFLPFNKILVHTFTLKSTSEIANAVWNGYNNTLSFTGKGVVIIYTGNYGAPSMVYVNGVPYTNWYYDDMTRELVVAGLQSHVEVVFPSEQFQADECVPGSLIINASGTFICVPRVKDMNFFYGSVSAWQSNNTFTLQAKCLISTGCTISYKIYDYVDNSLKIVSSTTRFITAGETLTESFTVEGTGIAELTVNNIYLGYVAGSSGSLDQNIPAQLKTLSGLNPLFTLLIGLLTVAIPVGWLLTSDMGLGGFALLAMSVPVSIFVSTLVGEPTVGTAVGALTGAVGFIVVLIRGGKP